MRLTESEKVQLIHKAYARTLVKASFAFKAKHENFVIGSDWFSYDQMMLLADMVADAVSEKYKENILYALDKDE